MGWILHHSSFCFDIPYKRYLESESTGDFFKGESNYSPGSISAPYHTSVFPVLVKGPFSMVAAITMPTGSFPSFASPGLRIQIAS